MAEMNEVKITEEQIGKAVEHFMKLDSGSKTFTEAYNKGEPYFFKRHRSLIVPSEMLNKFFGCSKYRMSAELVEMLQKYGAKRAYRQIYVNGKQSTAILVWVFEV